MERPFEETPIWDYMFYEEMRDDRGYPATSFSLLWNTPKDQQGCRLQGCDCFLFMGEPDEEGLINLIRHFDNKIRLTDWGGPIGLIRDKESQCE